MATSTIKNKNVKINGYTLSGDMTSYSAGIGRTVIWPSAETKSVASSGTRTKFTKQTLSAGTWFINVRVQFLTNTNNGSRNVALVYDSSGGIARYCNYTTGATGGGQTCLNLFWVLTLDAQNDIAPAVFQQSGSAMNVTVTWHALRV